MFIIVLKKCTKISKNKGFIFEITIERTSHDVLALPGGHFVECTHRGQKV